MPLVKIDYVVSFSSEDPEHPASNLLSSEVKSKWLCSAGEPSCSVVLQLKSACKINSITIGAYHVALLEVLVGLSEKPNDPFQVLVPSCVLLSPGASRRGEAVECVRSFGAAQLAGAPAARRWDRVRLVCSQPYNKHCKYGLAFVHISSAEGAAGEAAAGAAAGARRALRLDADAASDDDEFRPGELFARHRSQLARRSTDAQIRQASSRALKNIPDASTELTRTPIARTGGEGQPYRAEHAPDRREQSLLYTHEDDEPHDKTDGVPRTHRDTGDDRQPPGATAHKLQNTQETTRSDRGDGGDKLNSSSDARRARDRKPDNRTHSNDKTPRKKRFEKTASGAEEPASQTKRKRSGEKYPELGPVCESPGEVLAGAAVALSGYVNPERAALRAAALELGARYLRDWDPSCTHLICAFPNTPKLRALRAARAGAVAVRGAWLLQCARRRRRLPWRWFATEPREREPAPPDLDRLSDQESEGDTDDEIEKVLKQQGKKPRNSSPDRTAADGERDRTNGAGGRDLADGADGRGAVDATDGCIRPGGSGGAPAADADDTAAADASRDSDVAFVRDERVQAQISLHSDSDATDEDERAQHPDSVTITKELPAPWAGRTFALSARLPARDAALLARYIRAYGGLALQEHELLEDSSVTYVVDAAAEGAGGAGAAGGEAGAARRVRPDWVWRRLARY